MPYMVDDNRGHEMINEFTDFYNAPESIFADGNTNYKKLQAGTVK
jgi:mannan endo-1,4-beta-mannosidase